MMLRGSFSPSKIRVISTPCAFLTLYISLRTSAGTGYMRKPFSPRSSIWVRIPASLKVLVKARTASFGLFPARSCTCSKAPPFVSTRLKHPISTMMGAISANCSARGWNFPEDCHMSRYTRLNRIFFLLAISITFFCSLCLHFLYRKDTKIVPTAYPPQDAHWEVCPEDTHHAALPIGDGSEKLYTSETKPIYLSNETYIPFK